MGKPEHRRRRATARNRPDANRLALIAGGLVVALLLGGIALATGGASQRPAAPIGAQVGEVAPDFSVPTLDGGVYTLADQRGKPTIVFFMAYWCGTCLPEASALAQLQQEYGDRLSIVALDLDPSSTVEALSQFRRASGDGAFTWAFDANQNVTTAYEVISLDTTLILDGEGRVVYRDQYPTRYEALKDELAKLGL